jgi:hypothetical protein
MRLASFLQIVPTRDLGSFRNAGLSPGEFVWQKRPARALASFRNPGRAYLPGQNCSL